jgi:hypothetical protein
MKFDYKVAEEVAIQWVSEFVDLYAMSENTDEDLKDNYPQVIQAVRLGLLTFDNDNATLTLKDPLKTETGSLALETVQFKTRIPFSEKKKLSSGINIQKDRYEYFGRIMAYTIGQPVAMLDKIKPFDLKVIEQLSTLFI